jgi:tetraacyldisaccharide 4'-kinase
MPESNTNLEQLFFWGRPLSPLYSCLMANRSSLYRRGVFKQHKLEVPVISVGNLVLGGTGKTPLVHSIAHFLQRQNRRPAILSRGYKGSASSAVNIVSNGADILLDAEQAGDEPLLLAEKLPDVPVITGKKRVETGRFAIDTYGVDSLILDDGFQHLSLKRDINLVLFSADKFLGNGLVLPGGELREPISALKRADAFILSGVDTPLNEQEREFIKLLNSLFPETPAFTGSFVTDGWLVRTRAGSHETLSFSEVSGVPVYGFCGIARPKSFQNSLEQLNMNMTGFQSFRDHHAYTAADIKSLYANGSSSGAQALITTEKDLVKIRDLISDEGLPLLTLPIRLQMGKDFEQYLLDSLDNLL